jgi:hypothetical protein
MRTSHDLARILRALRLSAFLLALSPLAARAATLTVLPAAGTHPIQHALDRAQRGDTVLVTPGDYEERIVLRSGVTLRSAEGPARTRILGDLRGSVIQAKGVDSLTRLEGFTVTRGKGTRIPEIRYEGGAGLLAWRSAVRIKGNVFLENQLEVGEGAGGAVALWESPAVLEGNEFDGNVAHRGGAVYARQCSLVVIRSNHFIHNTSDAYGGAVNLDHGTRGIVQGNVMERNDAGWGGALLLGEVTLVEVIGNSFVSNHARHWGGGLFMLDCRALVVRNLFAENGSDFGGGGLGSGKAGFPDLRCNLGWHNTPQNFWAAESLEVAGLRDQSEEDPGFCNYLNGDFHPRPGGPANREPCGLIGALPADCPRPPKLVR